MSVLNPVHYESVAYRNLLELLILIWRDPENNPRARTPLSELLNATAIHELSGQVADERARAAIRAAAGAVITENAKQIAQAR